MEDEVYYEDYGSHGALQEEAMQEAAESQLIAVEKAMILSNEACEAVTQAANLVNKRQEQAQHRIQDMNGKGKAPKKVPLEESLLQLKKEFEMLQEGFGRFFEKCQEILVEIAILVDLEKKAEHKES
ncbi:hypothetical protein [Desulfatibacillum aliphaticivorans]|uniref:Uncharacterized protein n=1 Tax=Desulfatibacillum aliphaticivorans TaxID=218208 RepID=B8FNR9_DESAL|nr:hypothetical protein [Desulfatibacillum aliphaticivorans]ACL06350.1 hypothetical protein Dalk_4672 [Desulfatibacillum aliphaticivorans]